MNCPWCGKEMLPGKMKTYGNADLLWEFPDEKYDKLDRLLGSHRRRIRCTDKMLAFSTKTDALHCPDCKKFIFEGWLE